MTIEELRQNRDRGITFLDSEVPEWRDLINREKLDMAYYNTCIMGQLTGDYERGLEEFSLADHEATKLGFSTGDRWADGVSVATYFENYAKLTEVWKEPEVWEVA